MITRDKKQELDDPQNESTTAEAALRRNDEEDDTPRKPEPGTTMDAVEKSDDQAQAQTQLSSDSNNMSHAINSSIVSPSKVRGGAGVQVTPLPPLPAMRLVEEFQVGKILGLPFSDALTTPITIVTKEEEASYIRVTLARAHLAKVVADMHTMKDEQALKIAHIMERYKVIEQGTQARYENFVNEIKSKAKHKIEDEKRKYAALESASTEKEAQAAIDKQSLLEQHEQEKKLHEQQRERWREHLESSLQQHEDAMAHCHVLVQRELARVSKVHDLDRDKQLRKLRNELVMCWEDAKSESCHMFAQLEQLRKELLVKEKAFLRRVQKMQNDSEIELETLQCLNTVVNHVVDMAQHQSQQHKTRELTTQISKLESEMEQAAQRESSLQIRLEHARERFASIERAAVVDTMESILQTLEIALATPLKLAAVTIDTITTGIQTDQQEQEQVEQDPGMAMTLPQLQYESQVERLRERNLDLLHSKQHLKAQKAALQTLLEKKNVAKTQIKAWLADFQAENGREPTIEDKAQVKDLYLLFKASEEAYNSKKESVVLLKASHHEKVLEIDTIAQWQAIGDTMRKSARTEENGDGLCASGTSSASSSRPVSSSLSFRTGDGTTTVEEEEQGDTSSPRKVSALEHELWLLRAELEAVKRACDKENGAIAETTRSEVSELFSTVEEREIVSTSHEQDRESMQPEQEVQFEEAESGDYMDVPNEEDAEDEKESEAEVGQSSLSLESETAKARLEALVQQEELKRSIFQANELEQLQLQALKQQQELVTVEMEQQRASLQTTITQLTLEIDQRKEEKAKLEKEIEQLRLYLELMELNHDDYHHDDHEDHHGLDNDESIDHQSDEKQPSTMRAKREAGQNTFFDDEEAVESESDDDNDEVDTGHQNVSGRKTLDDDGELLDTNEGDEDENNEQDDMYRENADAKDAAVALEEAEEEEEDEKDTETPSEKDDFMTILHLVSIVRDAVEQGKAQFNRGDKAKCYQTYLKASEKCVEELRAMHQSRREDVAGFKAALSEAARLPAARSSMILRKQLDLLLADCEKRLKDREERAAAKRRLQLERSMAKQAAVAAEKASSPSRRASSKSPSPTKKSHKKATPQDLFDSSDNKPSSPTKALSSTTPAAVGANATPMAGGKVLEEYKQKLKALEAKAKSDKVKITQLEASLAKAESQFSSSGGNANSSSNGGGPNSAVLERKMVEMEKKHKHALEDAEKSLKKEITSLSQQLQAAQTKSQSLQDQVAQSQKELSLLGGKATQLSKLEDEMVTLKQQAAQASALSEELAVVKLQLGKLETSYKEEQSLRKKYYNMIEDMKGKIRVYARCRPMSSSELERGCSSCVKFVDEYSLELETSRGPKPFAFDQVFSPASPQDQVFEDTKNLLQSAIDGYNICIFAYGQTGSGKTFTMTGTDSMPGLSPRAISHLFALAEDAKSNNVITFQAFMLELYNDNLIDLFHLVDLGHDRDSAAAAAHKLEIKKNDKGMVFVANSTMKVCMSAQQTLKLFEAANKKRQVGSTKMNAESSRSHSVFSILVENYNKTTKATSIGKLSLVDLAGSERAGKTGATAERLKEAQAINKSLSALGDVISALSTNEKFTPYRNNKLTQLMQNSLGGNAKTLMFVNISPADYNQEETQTSLQYASRVKLITNNANKNSESELVNRLKHIIKQLKAGKTDVELDGIIE